MDAKFTPGPWEVVAGSGGIKHADGFIAFTAIPRTVSDARLDGESWLDMRERTEDERLAVDFEQRCNTRLIAAAPELLEALLAILPDALDNHCGGSDTAGRIAKARAAIAKAMGE